MPAQADKERLNEINNARSQIADEIPKLEESIKKQSSQEDKTENLESKLHGSLSRDGVRELEKEIEVETKEGKQNLDEIQNILGMEENSIKQMAQVTSDLKGDLKNTSNEMDNIESQLAELKKEAKSGNVDPQLAARVFAEITQVMEQLEEDSEVESSLADLSEGLGSEIHETHKDLIQEKKNEVELRDEVEKAEKIADENGVSELKEFVENEEAPKLKSEVEEMQTEIQEEKGEEQEFMEVMKDLAKDGELTENQLDRVMNEEQSWSAVIKGAIDNGSLSARNFSQALLEASDGFGDLMSGAGGLMSGAGSFAEGISGGAGDLLGSLGEASETLAEGKKTAMENASKATSEASDAASTASS